MDQSLAGYDLCIRPLAERDVSAFVTAIRESVNTVGAWLSWFHADYSEADARAWFAQSIAGIQAAREYNFGVFDTRGEQFFGGVCINHLNVRHNLGNIGYWVRESCQRRGVAPRAVRLIARYGFDVLKLTRLEIVAAEQNRPSRVVAERVGAGFECIARNRIKVHGQPTAAAVYSLVPDQPGF